MVVIARARRLVTGATPLRGRRSWRLLWASSKPLSAGVLPWAALRDIYRVVAQPGTAHVAQPHMPGTMEHVILSIGRALVGPEGEAVELGPGDYVRYPSDVRHVFDALEPDTAGVLLMEHA